MPNSPSATPRGQTPQFQRPAHGCLCLPSKAKAPDRLILTRGVSECKLLKWTATWCQPRTRGRMLEPLMVWPPRPVARPSQPHINGGMLISQYLAEKASQLGCLSGNRPAGWPESVASTTRVSETTPRVTDGIPGIGNQATAQRPWRPWRAIAGCLRHEISCPS